MITVEQIREEEKERKENIKKEIIKTMDLMKQFKEENNLDEFQVNQLFTYYKELKNIIEIDMINYNFSLSIKLYEEMKKHFNRCKRLYKKNLW